MVNISATIGSAKYKGKSISPTMSFTRFFNTFNQYLNFAQKSRIISYPTSSSESIYIYEAIGSYEKEYEVSEEFYQIPKDIRELAVKISDYLKYEWDNRYFIRDLKLTHDDEISDQAKIVVVFKENLDNKAPLFNKLLEDIFNKFNENDKIWDITIVYR